jgi:general secretion pathway protein G
VQIDNFGIGLNAFAEDCGRYPSSTEGLEALIERPSELKARWHGPYMMGQIPLDPWAHEYVYLCPSTHSTNPFEIYSRGPDGVTKTGGDDPDDVNSWKPKRSFGQ